MTRPIINKNINVNNVTNNIGIFTVSQIVPNNNPYTIIKTIGIINIAKQNDLNIIFIPNP